MKQIQDENGNVTETKEPVLLGRTVSQETSDLIKDYMYSVVRKEPAQRRRWKAMTSEERREPRRNTQEGREITWYPSSGTRLRRTHR